MDEEIEEPEVERLISWFIRGSGPPQICTTTGKKAGADGPAKPLSQQQSASVHSVYIAWCIQSSGPPSIGTSTGPITK